MLFQIQKNLITLLFHMYLEMGQIHVLILSNEVEFQPAFGTTFQDRVKVTFLFPLRPFPLSKKKYFFHIFQKRDVFYVFQRDARDSLRSLKAAVMKQPKADSKFLAYLLIFLMMSFEDQIKNFFD